MMKIITEPTVTVVGRTVFIPHPDYPIPGDGNDAIRLSAFAAKGCYDSFGAEGRNNRDNQNAVLAQGHGSVLEHYHISVYIEGISRGLSLELNRHRHFAISQRSTRYTSEENAAIVLDPFYAKLHALGEDASSAERSLLRSHIFACQLGITAYEDEVDRLIRLNPEQKTGTALRKWARGKARSLLPHGIETRGTWTANIRAWRHFIETRSAPDAEPEIRRLTGYVYAALYEHIGYYLDDYEIEVVDGCPHFTTPHKKV